MSDLLTVQWTPPTGQPQRVTFSYDPHTDSWLRITACWTGTTWRETGCELIAELTIEGKEAIDHV